MPTFAELRSRLTPPTEAEVVATIRAEIMALATEFAAKSDVTPFGWTGEAAKRLMRRACAEMHKSRVYTLAGPLPSLADLITAYDAGADELTRQAFRADRDDYIDEAADALVATADDMAAYWREHKSEAAA